MMSQITPKHILDNQIAIKFLYKVEMNPNYAYPFSDPFVK